MEPAEAQVFSALFDHPGPAYRAHLAAARALVGRGSAGLGAFVDAVEGLDDGRLEELFFRTFEGAPLVVPYLSVHLFGEESFQRSELMAGLAEAYQRERLDPGAELPDHLATVLRLGPQLPEWPELLLRCLLPAAAVMLDEARLAKSPYAQLLDALVEVLAHEAGVPRPAKRPLPGRSQRVGPPGAAKGPGCAEVNLG